MPSRAEDFCCKTIITEFYISPEIHHFVQTARMAVLKSTHAYLKWQDYKNLLNIIQNNGYVIDMCDSTCNSSSYTN